MSFVTSQRAGFLEPCTSTRKCITCSLHRCEISKVSFFIQVKFFLANKLKENSLQNQSSKEKEIKELKAHDRSFRFLFCLQVIACISFFRAVRRSYTFGYVVIHNEFEDFTAAGHSHRVPLIVVDLLSGIKNLRAFA